MNNLSIDCFAVSHNEFEKIIKDGLNKLINKEITDIYIDHIVSSDFLEMFDLDTPDDFNGWECDWWSSMYYKNTEISICGGAFYGTISLSLSEEDDDVEDEGDWDDEEEDDNEETD